MATTQSSIRSFIAVPLNDAVRDALARTVERLRALPAKVRWVPAADVHVTLKFLGDVAEGRIASIAEAIDRAVAESQPFEVRIGGLGRFPPRGRPTVVWAGVKENDASLSQLHGRMEKWLHELGFPGEERRFVPHVTLGRVRGGAHVDRLSEAIERYAETDFGSVTVGCVRLMMSTLRPRGAEHAVMSTHPLGGGAGTENEPYR